MEDWSDKFDSFEWGRFEKIADIQNWFQIFRLTPDTFAIWEPWHREMVISYLITGSQRALLFDTGLGIGDIQKAVAKFSISDVAVLNSHSHYDHIGGNHQFDTIYGVDIGFAHENSNGKTHHQAIGYLIDNVFAEKLPSIDIIESYEIHGYSISRYIKNGDVIDLGNRPLEIIFSPGHSPDSLCLYDRRNKALFIGDTFYLSSLYCHLPGSDFDEYLKTAAMLESLSDSIDLLYPCHRKTAIPSAHLIDLHNAFHSIRAQTAQYQRLKYHREYLFDHFSVII